MIIYQIKQDRKNNLLYKNECYKTLVSTKRKKPPEAADLKVVFKHLCFPNVIMPLYKHPSKSLQPSLRDCKSTAFLLF